MGRSGEQPVLRQMRSFPEQIGHRVTVAGLPARSGGTPGPDLRGTDFSANTTGTDPVAEVTGFRVPGATGNDRLSLLRLDRRFPRCPDRQPALTDNRSPLRHEETTMDGCMLTAEWRFLSRWNRRFASFVTLSQQPTPVRFQRLPWTLMSHSLQSRMRSNLWKR